jgi:hypothetical protein
MPWAATLEEVSEHLTALISAAEAYRDEVQELRERAIAANQHTPRTLKVWQWQTEAASSFYTSLEDLHDEFMRVAEQDYVLRRPDADDILA